MQILKSNIDESINWVQDDTIGKHETRLVFRTEKTIIYLSSQTGCDHACRMCHLTQTGQTAHRNVAIDELVGNCDRVLAQLALSRPLPVDRLHVNFMARGEPLANQELIDQWEDFSEYASSIQEAGYAKKVELLVSTIFPKSFGWADLPKLTVGPVKPKLYYSAYSADEAFRRKWLPKAHAFYDAIEMLRDWQYMGGQSKIHFAFIEGENDGEDHIEEVCTAIEDAKLHVDFNIVRYNPANDKSAESSEDIINRNAKLIRKLMPYSKVKIIPRVGFDVKASCGCFV